MKHNNDESICPNFERLGLIASRVLHNKLPFNLEYTDNETCTLSQNAISERIVSGISELDKLLEEFHSGGLYSICGRPGMGKKTLILDMILNISRSSCVPIYFVSLELLKEQIAIRLFNKLAGISLSAIGNSVVLNEELKCLINNCLSVMNKMTVFICDKSPCRTTDIEKIIESNVHKGIVFIDYVQMISGEKEVYDNPTLELCDVVRFIKLLARNKNIPIVVTSQLSRRCESRVNKKPFLSDLRDNGVLEQESDGIILIYRNDYYYEGKNNLAELNLAKNRYGDVGVATVKYDSKSASFI